MRDGNLRDRAKARNRPAAGGLRPPGDAGAADETLDSARHARHGVHENGRYLSDKVPLLAEQMKRSGYRTAAFISAFAIAKRFGLGRGFDTWDEDFCNSRAERNAKETT